MLRMFRFDPADETWKIAGAGDLPLLRSGDTLRVLGAASDVDYGAVAVGLGLAVLNHVKIVRLP